MKSMILCNYYLERRPLLELDFRQKPGASDMVELLA